jgi:hypothetical protein
MKIKYRKINDKLNRLIYSNNENSQQRQHQQYHTFYQRVSNLSSTTFTHEEMTLLNKGLKYNLHHKPKQWLQTLAIVADMAISQLAPQDQSYMRQTVAHKLKIISKKEERMQHNRQDNTEKRLIIKVRKKLIQNKLIITKADKGNTLVIMGKDDYYQKIDEFITDNQFIKIENNYTKKQ